MTATIDAVSFLIGAGLAYGITTFVFLWRRGDRP